MPHNLFIHSLCSRIATFETYSGFVYAGCIEVVQDEGQVNTMGDLLFYKLCCADSPSCSELSTILRVLCDSDSVVHL